MTSRHILLQFYFRKGWVGLRLYCMLMVSFWRDRSSPLCKKEYICLWKCNPAKTMSNVASTQVHYWGSTPLTNKNSATLYKYTNPRATSQGTHVLVRHTPNGTSTTFAYSSDFFQIHIFNRCYGNYVVCTESLWLLNNSNSKLLFVSV